MGSVGLGLPQMDFGKVISTMNTLLVIFAERDFPSFQNLESLSTI
jgi:hypothetical protein